MWMFPFCNHWYIYFTSLITKNVGLQVALHFNSDWSVVPLSCSEKEPYLHWKWCLTAHERLSPGTDKPTAVTPFISVLLMMTWKFLAFFFFFHWKEVSFNCHLKCSCKFQLNIWIPVLDLSREWRKLHSPDCFCFDTIFYESVSIWLVVQLLQWHWHLYIGAINSSISCRLDKSWLLEILRLSYLPQDVPAMPR